MINVNNAAIAIFVVIFSTGCATVKMESKEASEKLKLIPKPAEGNAGFFLYRDSGFGSALKKDIFVNGRCIGESAPNTFFHTEVEGGKVHLIETESEFSRNNISLMAEAGKNYFIRQFIKFGVFVGGADLEVIPEETAKLAIAKLDLAVSGKCGD
jgi:hypothetical protein